ncbi:unannotated protein [freshwater metagenome]|uniref:Unannotated protein n=1 Tax=freshwater metagenome TaxID=449393 RepID=A0A6J7SKE6_9ZZZZ
MSTASRTLEPKIPTWLMVWLAPIPRNDAGRSAVIAMKGTLEKSASIIAGSKFAAAVPEVVTTTAGTPVTLPKPSARKAADRSSRRTCKVRSPLLSAAARAKAKPADREPGARTTSLMPHRSNSSTMTRDIAVVGFTPLPFHAKAWPQQTAMLARVDRAKTSRASDL